MLPDFRWHFFFVITMNIDTNIKPIEFSLPNQNQLKEEFESFAECRHLIIYDLKERLENILSALDTAVVVNGRVKSFSSYFNKYLDLYKTSRIPPNITDLMGLRIICPFIQDIIASEKLIHKNFVVTEIEKKGGFSYNEFGYESIHLLIKIPDELIEKHGYSGTNIVEIQIRTILQDAWAEVEHQLVYKAEFNPVDSVRRKLAAANANLSLIDIIFKEIREHQITYSAQMGTRRKSFYKKVEKATDELLFQSEIDGEAAYEAEKIPPEDDILPLLDDSSGKNPSFDDLLVKALIDHNQGRFNEAISQYTQILKINLENKISSVIYKHRGMAKFACSRYDEAISDFTAALELDHSSYKAAYYRGIVSSVLKDYSKAIDDYTLSLKIYAIQPFCLFRRAQAYYHIGDFHAALADCENSVAVEPSNELAIKFKDLLLQKLNNLFLG